MGKTSARTAANASLAYFILTILMASPLPPAHRPGPKSTRAAHHEQLAPTSTCTIFWARRRISRVIGLVSEIPRPHRSRRQYSDLNLWRYGREPDRVNSKFVPLGAPIFDRSPCRESLSLPPPHSPTRGARVYYSNVTVYDKSTAVPLACKIFHTSKATRQLTGLLSMWEIWQPRCCKPTGPTIRQ